jgi:hypothetical protein
MQASLIARCLLLWAGLLLSGFTQAQSSGILINGVELTQEQVIHHQIMVPSGRYWYDPVSGLWGQEGGPFAGQILPDLDLGGPMRADASGGNTGVFINGRELHLMEVQYLALLFGEPVPLGRYWMGWDGIGGPEGGPATFSLAGDQGGGQGSSPVFEDQVADFCARNGGCPW